MQFSLPSVCIHYKIFLSFRKCLGTDTIQTCLFTTKECQKSSSEAPKTKHYTVKRMSATSIMTSKCFYTLHQLYIRCLYHSGSSLVTIPHEQVRLPPQNTRNPALEPRNGGTLGCKMDVGHFNYDFQVFVYIALVIYKMLVSFRKCLGTDPP